MNKRLTLCADDYAQSPEICAAILELLAAGRLSATSAMTQSPLWPQAARDLRALAAQVDVGLHFNLTHAYDATARPLSYWMLCSQLAALSRADLRDALLRQIDAFADQAGRLPDFIDGHQHVHAFAVVRLALTDAIARRWTGHSAPYVRAPERLVHGADSAFKAAVLRWLCRGCADHLQAHGLRSPPGFAGLYSLRPEAARGYATLMQTWLRDCPPGGLIMCHPGRGGDDSDDPLGKVRVEEYRYLASPAFADCCQRLQVTLTRFA